MMLSKKRLAQEVFFNVNTREVLISCKKKLSGCLTKQKTISDMDIMIWVSIVSAAAGYVLGIYIGRNFKKFTEE